MGRHDNDNDIGNDNGSWGKSSRMRCGELMRITSDLAACILLVSFYFALPLRFGRARVGDAPVHPERMEPKPRHPIAERAT
jgi:hypothetical protein